MWEKENINRQPILKPEHPRDIGSSQSQDDGDQFFRAEAVKRSVEEPKLEGDSEVGEWDTFWDKNRIIDKVDSFPLKTSEYQDARERRLSPDIEIVFQMVPDLRDIVYEKIR